MRRGIKRTVSIILTVLLTVTILPADVLNAADFSTAKAEGMATSSDLNVADEVNITTNVNGADKAANGANAAAEATDNTFTLDSGVVVTVEKADLSNPADTDETADAGYERVVGGDFPIDYIPEVSNLGIDEAILGDGGEEVALPSKWTRADNPYISSVKNQGHFGCCWSMSMMANTEAADMKINGVAANETDFSEKHLVNFFYSDELSGPNGGIEGDHNVLLQYSTWLQAGGNVNLAAPTVMSWKGATKENADPSLVFPSGEGKDYSYRLNDSLAYNDALHMKTYYSFNLDNKDLIKKHIKEYGAASVSYTAITQCEKDGSFDGEYSSAKGLHYYPKAFTNSELAKLQCSAYVYEAADGIVSSSDGGHAVTIVGWDDDFDRNNFKDTNANKNLKYTIYNSIYATSSNPDGKKVDFAVSAPVLPEKNGAWLIKNSWGENYGDEGFFWMSYEDAGLRDCAGYIFENVDSTEHIYQYDGSCAMTYWSEYSKTAPKFANVFTVDPKAGKNQLLDAVAVGIKSADATVNVSVYTNPKDEKNPESGTLVSEVKGFKTNASGYYNVPLTSKPVVAPGTTVAVVAAPILTSPQNDKSLVSFMCDRDWDSVWVKSVGNVKEGQSFVCGDSTVSNPVWTDMISRSVPGNFRIKLYTKDTDQKVSGGTADISAADVNVIYDKGKTSFTYTGKMIEPKVNATLNGNALAEGEDYILEYGNNLVAGNAVVAVKGIGAYTGTKAIEFVISKKTAKSTEFSAALEIAGGTPKISVYNKEGEVSAGTYTVDAIKDSNGAAVPLSNVEADKTYEVTASFMNYDFSDTKSSTASMKDVKCTSDNKFTVGIKDPAWVLANCIYNGKPFKPEVIVKSGGSEVPSKSYAITYYNNKEAGTALAVVKGKGDFKDYTGSCSFEIQKKKIDANTATIEIPSNKKFVYNGKNQMPKVTVKDNDGKALKLNTDYKVTYQNCKNAGNNTASAVVKFNSNYNVVPRSENDGINQVAVPFTIEKAQITSVKQKGKYYVFRATGEGYDSSEITGEVKAGKTKLNPNEYKLEIAKIDSSSNKPNMEINVVSLNPNYTCDKSIKYKLEQKEDLKDAHISYIGVPYVGMRYSNIYGVGVSSRVDNTYYKTQFEDFLIQNKPSSSVKPGKYKIKLTAEKNNPRFSGSTTVEYEIYKIDLSSPYVNLAGLAMTDKGVEYTKSDLEKALAGRAGYELKFRNRVISIQGYPALNIDKIFKDKCEVRTVRGKNGEKYIEIYATDDSKLFAGSVKIILN